MRYIAIGGDVSKGRLDIAILNESGTRLHAGCYDDTAEGHERVATVLAELRRRHPDTPLLVGLESTGGMERNWLAFFRSKRWGDVRAHRVNPMAVKRYLTADLHRAVTDAHAAVGIARYLLERVRDQRERDDSPSAAVVFYRGLRSAIDRRVQIEQQLHALLIQVHPELVRHCRSGIADWIIDLLERYPTAERLARARPEGMSQLPFAARKRADDLVARARTSVAALTGDAAAAAIQLLVRQWRDLQRTIADAQKTLTTLVAQDPLHARQIALLASITGIGEWTATILSLEIGDLTRFDSHRALIAWCGLDPHEDRSGDGVIKRGISHRGNANVRRALFMPALTAAQRNVAVAALWDRLVKAGKSRLVAAVACMHKLLRIAYGVVTTGRAYDPAYERTRCAHADGPHPVIEAATPTSTSLDAPITAAEARRRRHAAAPGPNVRDQSPNGHRSDRGDSLAPASGGPAPTTPSASSEGPSTGPRRPARRSFR